MGIVEFCASGEWPILEPIAAEHVASGQPEQRGVELFADPGAGLTVGLWSCTPWVSRGGPYSVDEFMVLLDGSVTIRLPDGRTETVKAGETFFLPKGLHCSWEQTETVRKIYVIFENGSPDPQADFPLRVDSLMALASAAGPAASVLEGPEPRQQFAQAYADASDQFTVGVWASSPYVRRPISYPRHELMHLLEGEVTLTSDDGVARTYRSGDTFLVPKGCVVDWVSTVDVRKIYCSIEPAE